MKKVEMKRWFWIEKKMDMRDTYHCQDLAMTGEVIGETAKSYKLSVLALFLNREKAVTVWAPKSCCIEIAAAQ